MVDKSERRAVAVAPGEAAVVLVAPVAHAQWGSFAALGFVDLLNGGGAVFAVEAIEAAEQRCGWTLRVAGHG